MFGCLKGFFSGSMCVTELTDQYGFQTTVLRVWSSHTGPCEWKRTTDDVYPSFVSEIIIFYCTNGVTDHIATVLSADWRRALSCRYLCMHVTTNTYPIHS